MKNYIFKIDKKHIDLFIPKLTQYRHNCNYSECFNKSQIFYKNENLNFNYDYDTKKLFWNDNEINYTCAKEIGCKKLVNFELIYLNNILYLISSSNECSCIENKVGIDLNSNPFITTSNNDTYCLEKTNKYIEKLNVKMNLLNDEENKDKISKIQKHIKSTKLKIENTLKYELNLIVNDLLYNYDVIYLENLGLTFKQKFNYKINNYVYSLFRSILVSKAHILKISIRFVEHEFASTKMCSECLNINVIEIDQRCYFCKFCNLKICRDFNAALNIFNQGEKIHAK